MTSLKTFLLLGVAVTALSACSSDRGPGQIGSANDIIIRNAGDPKAPPPKPLETPEAITEVDVAEAPVTTTTEATQTAQNLTAEAMPPAPAEKVEAVAPTTPAPATVPAVPPAVPAAPETPSAPAPVVASAVESVPTPMRGTKMITPEEAVPVPATTAQPTPVQPNAELVAPAPVQTPEPAPAQTLTMASLQSASPAEIKAIQESLSKAGFYTGKISGKINTETLNGMVRYEAAQGTLPKTPAPVSVPVATPSVKAAAPSAAPAPLPVSSAPVSPVPAPSKPASPVFPVTPAEVPPALALTAQTALTDPAMIRAVQEKLISAGLFKGAVNGKMDTSLLNALVSYQTSNGLVPGGLNLETVKKLGIVQ
ncbi:MAG: hypothetical protein J0L77_09545 [Alphaproteobacteria bacterium]|nr:hypothetical protein [Alphaproteobacteria bacterium]